VDLYQQWCCSSCPLKTRCRTACMQQRAHGPRPPPAPSESSVLHFHVIFLVTCKPLQAP
jgi:hypothetical protein